MFRSSMISKKSRVLEVTPGRDQTAGEAFWQALPEATCLKVEAAAMDLSGSYVAATHAQAPHAAIVHDKFPIAKMLNEAVDQTRRAEHVRLQAQGDDTLKGTRYQWLHGVVSPTPSPMATTPRFSRSSPTPVASLALSITAPASSFIAANSS